MSTGFSNDQTTLALERTAGQWSVGAKAVLPVLLCLALLGCWSRQSSKVARIRQVQRAIAVAGGETNVLNESRVLFSRLSKHTPLLLGPESSCFEGLRGITNLGDAYFYQHHTSDRVRVRVYNSHFDVFFIHILNPDMPEPAGFERVAGNVGFIVPSGAGKGSESARVPADQTSSAARPRR